MLRRLGFGAALLAAVLLAGCSLPRFNGSGDDDRLYEAPFEPHESAERTLRGEHELMVDGLQFPSSLAAAPDGRVFIAEFRTGMVHVMTPNGEDDAREVRPFARVPLPPGPEEEQGLWHVAVHPNQPYLYASAVSETSLPATRKGRWRVVRFELLEDGGAGELEEVCSGLPAAPLHSGGALAFGPDGLLYLSIGDVLDLRRVLEIIQRRRAGETLAWGVGALAGVILRVDPETCLDVDDPLAVGGAVFAMGFRNPYGLAFGPDGTLYATENGPACCDTVTVVEEGGDHGWPRYNVNPRDMATARADPDVVAPLVHTGESIIAPTQLAYYEDGRHEDLRNSLLYGTFHARSLMVLSLEADGVTVLAEEVLLTLAPERRIEFIDDGGINGVAVTPDGEVYFSSLSGVFRLTGIGPLP